MCGIYQYGESIYQKYCILFIIQAQKTFFQTLLDVMWSE